MRCIIHLCASYLLSTQARVILKVVKHGLGGLALGFGREVIVFWVSQRGRPDCGPMGKCDQPRLSTTVAADQVQHSVILRFLEEGSFSN